MIVDRTTAAPSRPVASKGTPRAARRRAWRPEREILEDRLAPAVGAWSAVGPTGPLPPAAASTTAETATAGDAALPLGLQYAASASLGADDPAYAAAAAAGGFAFQNAENGYSAFVDAGGLRVASGGDAWSLSVAGIGRGAASEAFGPATATATANRVEFDYGAVSQWFVNGPLGVQQGFTLDARPGGGAGGPLVIDLALGGGLVASADAGGAGVTLSRPDGSAALAYGGLIAYDATGAAFPASMSVTTADDGSQSLSIRVDDAGAQYPLVVDPYVQQAKLVGTASGSIQFFGSSVALAAGGSTAVIGARSSGVGTVRGSAYVFTRSGTTWTERTRLLPSDGFQGDDFGSATAITADGGTIVVGARGAQVGGKAGQGALYVFNGGGASWTQVQKIAAADGAAGDALGFSAAVSADGTVIAAGAVTANGGRGAVYVFGRTAPTTWAQGAKLTAFDAAPNAIYGFSTAISGDGATVIVGSPNAAVGGNAQQGAVYAYSQGVGVKLVAPDGRSNDGFGTSVATNYDGSIALVGSPFADVDGKADQGSAYAYFRSATSWSPAVKITAADGAASNGFGAAVAMSADGLTAAVTANFANVGANSRQGAVYLLARNGAAFTQTAKLSESDGAANDQFGLSLALSSDGSTLLAGVPNKTVGTYFFQGSSYVFYQQPTLAVTASPASRTATVGSPTTFTAASTGLPGRTVQWQVSPDAGGSWTDVAGATRTWYTVTPTLADSGNRYRAVFTDSTSATAATTPAVLTVAKASTALAVTSSVSPRRIGDPLQITVEAKSASGAGTPAGGTVSLILGALNLSAPLVGGKAVFDIPTIDLGTYVATATYDGTDDPSFGSAQATTTVVVVKGTSAVTPSVPTQATVGQSVTITAALGAAGNISNLAGGIMILDSGQPIAFPQLAMVGGVPTATFTTSTLSAGTHYLQFVFLGNPELLAASTGVYQLQVNPAGTQNAPASAPTSSAAPTATASAPATTASQGPILNIVNPGNVTATVGVPVTLTAAPTSASTSFAQWQVSVDSGATWVNLIGANQNWYTFTPTQADSGRRYRVVFTDLAGTSETSAPSTLTVAKGATTLKISSSVSPRRIGDPLKITIDATSPTGTPNGGTISLNVGTVNLSGTLVNGKAVFDVPTLGLGTYVATATYNGTNDPSFGSAQATTTVVVVKGTSAVTPSVPTQATVGQSVTITAALGAAGNISNLAGGIMILDSGQPIAFPQLAMVGGVPTATFTTSTLSAGTHYLQFVFLGNPELLAASTGVYQLQVNPAGTSGFAATSTTTGLAATARTASASASDSVPTATFVEALETIDPFASTSTTRKDGRAFAFPRAGAAVKLSLR